MYIIFFVGSACKIEELNSICGVGVEVSKDEITTFLNELVTADIDVIKQERYTYPFHTLLYKLQEYPRLKWADGKIVTSELEALKLGKSFITSVII